MVEEKQILIPSDNNFTELGDDLQINNVKKVFQIKGQIRRKKFNLKDRSTTLKKPNEKDVEEDTMKER